MGTLESYRKNARPRPAASSSRASVATKTQYVIKDLMWLPCSTVVQRGLISALVSLRALALFKVALTGLQDLRQQSEAPDDISSNASYPAS